MKLQLRSPQSADPIARIEKMERLVTVIVTGAIVMVLLFPLVAAYFEVQSYQKFCRTDVTWWDAIWLDLRIDECPGRRDSPEERLGS